MPNYRRRFEAGEKRCAHCGDALAAFESNIRPTYACDKPECRAVVYSNMPHPPKQRFIAEGQQRCQGPNCTKFMPAGWYSFRKRKFFCSNECALDHRKATGQIVGHCLCCGAEIRGPRADSKGKFLNREHQLRYYEEVAFAQKAGKFEAQLRNYMTSQAKNYYRDTTIKCVRSNVLIFAEFLNRAGITDLAHVTPRVITDFIRYQKDRGVSSGSYIGHISTMLNWFRAIGVVEVNPVVPRIHRVGKVQYNPRPYSDGKVEEFWTLLERGNDAVLKAAFWIGLASGLRIGEVCRLTISDCDLDSQKLLIDIPNKSMKPRTVPFDENAKKFIEQWLTRRDPECPSAHLFHNSRLRPFSSSTLQARFQRYLAGKNGSEMGFSFHALRHTWASRLLNAKIDPAVLMELGGWASWEAMQRYIKVYQKTIDDEFERANATLRQQQSQPDAEQFFSLTDFAGLADTNVSPASQPA